MQTFLDCVLKLAPFWKRHPTGKLVRPLLIYNSSLDCKRPRISVALVREATTLQIEYDLDNIVKDLGVANFNFSYFKKVNKMKLKIHNSGNY